MTQALTVGLVTPGWPGRQTPNGIATAVRHMARGLLVAGHQPVILAMAIDGKTPHHVPVVEISRREWTVPQKIAHRLGRRDLAQTVFAASIADAVALAHEAHGLDAVIVEETHGWALRTIQRGVVPVVVCLHGPWILHKALQSAGSAQSDARRVARESAAMQAATALISPSHNVLHAVENEVGVTHVPRSVIPNAYALDSSSRPRHAPNHILFVGRFDFHKGGDTILEAFGTLHARRPSARMTFVGPSSSLRKPDGTVATMRDTLSGLPSATRAAIATTGPQTAEEVSAHRQTHPIAVIASRYENLNYTMLEAMAAGQAIVSTDVGGPAEVFRNGDTALLVPADDPTAMAAALERLLDDPQLTARLGCAARAHVLAEFDPEQIAQQTAEFLQSVLLGR